ncbi:helix-turn-helix transcriptional regulator [Mariniflexile litorale]|uniref:Helix-turn-helix transcriptional regulator n=1 Tax=Mariniflexile litorale TaxID=3045158 RepID=A0AAU7EBZ9_9FLAO|nr:helix-turn-helix transcriptional regulator [Mariniflexile sp. KMM 9835]MDQ8213546.1 helix-turn-helix transcriptional regulator [Mariniflexile sp. KMM 9835]
MKTKIKTYDSEGFRKEYFNDNSRLDELFKKSIIDFFCLRIEDLISGVLKPILPSKEESHTFIFVTEGSYKTKIGFKEYEIKPNQVLTIQAGVVFSVEQIIKNVKGYTCHFHPNTLIGKFGNRSLISEFEFLNVGNYPIIGIKESSMSAILNIFKRLATEFANDNNPNIIHTYLYTLLTELKILVGESNLVKQGASYQITTQFRTLVHAKVKENLKVTDFARIMNVSPNHLNKSVKSITAKSASEIIDEIKLIEIKYLLYQSTLSISEISYEMGYLDPSYFTRFFKKRENVSPTEFRELIEKS